MRSVFQVACVLLGVVAGSASSAQAQDSTGPAGLALVIATTNNSTMAAPMADQGAGLIAAALAQRQFSVIGARNLDDANLKAAFAEFKARIAAAPALPVFIYFGGPVVQFGNDNLVLATNTPLSPTGELVKRSVSLNAVIEDLTKTSTGKKILVIDGSRAPAQFSWPAPLASGLALPEVGDNMTISFNQTPGILTAENALNTSAFSRAWAEAIADGAPSSQALVDHVTLRSFVLSNGQNIVWSQFAKNKLGSVFESKGGNTSPWSDLHAKPMNILNATEALAAALLRHSIISYEEYILIHIQSPATRFSRAVLASLREATIWSEAMASPSAPGAWAYLQIYPRGPHAGEAKMVLAKLGQPITPPADASILALVTTPPPNDEVALLAQTLPYRLDPEALGLSQFANQFKARWPELAKTVADLPKDAASPSAFGLPLPDLDQTRAALIELPAALPQAPMPPVLVEKPKAVTVAKPKTPLPPRRTTDETDPQNADATLVAPAPEPAPAPQPELIRPAPGGANSGDLFNQPFGTTPTQTTLPY